MSQHFLLSAAARTLSLSRIMRMTDDEARDTFKRIRWASTDGERATGMSISVRNTDSPPDSAKAFHEAMRYAGFPIRFEKFYGKYHTTMIFCLALCTTIK
jgi:hypothetical protein